MPDCFVDHGMDAFEARANVLKRERLGQSEIQVFRKAIVDVVASPQCRASFEAGAGFN
jgi:hypothetical protein